MQTIAICMCPAAPDVRCFAQRTISGTGHIAQHAVKEHSCFLHHLSSIDFAFRNSQTSKELVNVS